VLQPRVPSGFPRRVERTPDIQYSAQFNEFLTKFKTILSEDSEAWKAVKDADVSLSSTAEDPSLGVSPSEAGAFLHGEDVDVNLAVVAGQVHATACSPTLNELQ
jgi:hypothetical protein